MVDDNVQISDSVDVVLEGPIPQQGWRDQWRRVMRWKVRLEDLTSGRVREWDAAFAEDVFDAFFVSCCHLADWLKNDSVGGIRRPDPIEYLCSHPALSLCRDLANGHKHLTLVKSRVAQNDTRLSGRSVHWENAQVSERATPRYQFEVTWTDKQGQAQSKDSAKLADECVRAWDKFLETNLPH
jgi:hypothetical protein